MLSEGAELARAGGVTELSLTEGGVRAKVRDESGFGFPVSIPGKDDPEDPWNGFECLCAEGIPCRHMAAVLVAVGPGSAVRTAPIPDGPIAGPGKKSRPVTAPRGRRPSPLRDLRRLQQAGGGAESILVDIEAAPDSVKSRTIRDLVDPPLQPSAPPAAKDKPGFQCGLAFGIRPQRGSAGPAAQLHIVPCLRVGKQDDGGGHFLAFQRDRLTGPVEKSSLELLRMLEFSDGTAPLPVHWDFLRANPQVPLYPMNAMGHVVGDVPVLLTRVKAVTIAPTAASDVAEGTPTLRITPVLRFETEDGVFGSTGVPVAVSIAGDRAFFSFGIKAVAALDDDSRFFRLLASLLHPDAGLTVADIVELRRLLRQEKPRTIRMDFPYGKFRLLKAVPRTRVAVRRSQTRDATVVQVGFDYKAAAGGGAAVPVDHDPSRECVVHVRNQERESAVREALLRLFCGIDADGKAPVYHDQWGSGEIRIGTTIERFLAEFGEPLLEHGVELLIEGAAASKRSSGVSIRVTSGIDWFDLQAEADGERIDLASADGADPLLAAGFLRSGNRFLHIGPGGGEKLKRLLEGLGPEQASGRIRSCDLRAIAAIGALEPDDAPEDFRRRLEIHRLLMENEALPAPPVPASLRGILRDYQAAGYGWLRFLAQSGLGGCLADDMGLGKTLQALAFLLGLKEDGGKGPSLVVVPVSTLFNWKSEAARFTPELSVLVHHGPKRRKEPEPLRSHDVVLVSYATLREDVALFHGIEFHAAVLDEAQTVKNPLSQSFAAVDGLRARHRVTLTGTPLENSVIDLWSQMDFLAPGLLGGLRTFKAGFASMAGKEALTRLRATIRPFILRRTKEVVEKSLPTRSETILYALMDPAQESAYRAVRETWRKAVAGGLRKNGISKSGALILEGLLRLRQAACFPAHADAAYAGVPSCKMDVFAELIDEVTAEGHKALVFSQFVASLKELEGIVRERRLRYSYLDGATVDRASAVESFQKDPDVRLFLLSLKAGGVGLNLTAADYVILFDPWWNPAVERQAVDRSHRIGQDKPVFVYRIVTKDSIEERILELQERKRSLAIDLIEENPRSLLSLGEEEILALFGEP